MKRTSYLLAFALVLGISASAFGVDVPEVYEDFTSDTDTSWDGSGNRSAAGVNDYGWSNTDNTGNVVTAPSGGVSAAGEVGGFIQRGNMSYYGFETGDINPETDTIHADGVYRYVSGSGNAFFGFFNDAFHMESLESNSRNFIGIQLDDGINGLYHASTAVAMHREHNGPADVGASGGETIKWTIDYDPVNGADFTIGSDSSHVDAEFAFEDNAMLNRFGFFSTENSDTVGEYYWDDITFSSFNAIGIPGDVNNDGFVDIFDVNVVSLNWGSPGGPTGDANGDGNVDIFDVNLISFNWAPPPPPGGAAAVPEPASAVLAALGVLGLVCATGARRKRTVSR